MNRICRQYFPAAEDRARWSRVTEQARASLLADANELRDQPWPILPAVRYMDYHRNGNRSRYEAVYFDRRSRVLLNILAESVEHTGRLLDEVTNGCWAICEETSWVLPAHNGPYRGDRYPELPEATEPIVDLFAAETGSLLSAALQILGSDLHETYPEVATRMQHEVRNRIITPFLERTDFWWMGFTPREPNNWNPWIVSNILSSTCGLPPDLVDVQSIVDKALECLENFLSVYADDGACDEGPAYWGHAAGSLFDAADILKYLTDGRIDLLSRPKVAEMGRYMYRVHVDQRWFVNYADGPAWNSGASPQLLYRYGRAISDSTLEALGVYLHKTGDTTAPTYPGTPYPLRGVWALLYEAELSESARTYAPVTDAWFPGIQVVTARSEARANNHSLFFSAKGGDNHESHNHNDVGSFVLYCDGHPVIIDPGVEMYTSRTFSDRRYEIWTMQSAYHNLPVINGCDQIPDSNGNPRPPRSVTTDLTPELVRFSLDIAPTYPPDANVESWIRRYEFHRAVDAPACLDITEQMRFTGAQNTAGLVFMTWNEPRVQPDGVVFRTDITQVTLTMGGQQNCEASTARAEEIRITDERMSAVWGDRIYRVVVPLTCTARDALLSYRFSVYSA